MSAEEKKKFYCREWAFQKLSHCLDQRPVSKTCGALLLGGPGCGKTTFCAELCWPTQGPAGRQQRALSRRLLGYHFVSAQNERSLSLSEFVRGLVTQILNHSTESQRERSMRRRLENETRDGTEKNNENSEAPPIPNLPINPRTLIADAYLEKLKSDSEIQVALRSKNIEANPDDCLKRALLFPLLEIDPPKSSLFLLIDSIDEYSFVYSNSTLTRPKPKERCAQSRTIAELLANHHHLFPQWLLLVCTARKQSRSISRMFTGFRKLSLDDLRKSQVVRDVQQYILARLDEENSLRQHISRDTAEMLNQLHIKSNGCFLYLEKVLDGVANNFIVLREVREIPGTLNGLYLWLAQRLFNRKQFSKVQPLLNVILAARGPLTRDLLFNVVRTYSPLSTESFNKRLDLLRRILVFSKRGTVKLFHHSFGEWLLDIKHCTQKYLCNIFKGHAMLAFYYTVHGRSLGVQETYDFAHHLTRAEQYLWEKPLEDSVKMRGKTTETTEATSPDQLDQHSIVLLWFLLSGAPCEEAPLDPDAAANAGVSFPTEQRVLKLLSEAGAGAAGDEEGAPCATTPCSSSDTSPSPQQWEDGQAALHAAARLGQAALVAALLENGADADRADADGWTPLRAAAWGGHSSVVEMLVAHGCILDSVDGESRTALRAASWSGHEDIVRTLLRHGADPNLTDLEGRTALIAAAYMGHAEIVEHLLDHGANINHADADGRTALSVAALCAPSNHGYATVVSTLLDRGAQVDHRDKEGMTPLLVAAFEGHRDVCELLLEYEADVDHCDHAGRTPLWAAASMGHASVVALLLFWGCCIDSMDQEGRTVLSVAAAQGCVEVVRLLLDRGLDEQHRDNSGWTPLHYSAFEGHQEVCEALLEAGARVDEPDNEGKGALALAAQGGHASLVASLLLKHHAPVDQRPHDGKTALRLAALEGHYEVAQLLLHHGADIDSKDSDGRSTLYVLALDNRLAMAEHLLGRGADVETRDLEGRTPLHVSAWQGHLEMVALLLTRGGADVDACDNENRTALHSASWQGHADVVRLLLERSAAPDHTCNQGATALGIAAQEGHELCVVALLDHGADPEHSDSCGRNALRVASKSGHRGVVRLLEEYGRSEAEQQRRSCVSLGNRSSNSKSSSNLTGSSHSSRHGPEPPASVVLQNKNETAPVSFTRQLELCGRGGRTRPASRLLSPLRSEPQSPIYASPPLSPVRDADIYQPVLGHHHRLLAPQDTHFARDTHMRIILGNSCAERPAPTAPPCSSSSSSSKPKRNGIVTNPALRLVKNGLDRLDSAAANLRKSASSSSNPTTKTHSFQWRKETPL